MLRVIASHVRILLKLDWKTGFIDKKKMGVLALTEVTALALARSQVCEFL